MHSERRRWRLLGFSFRIARRRPVIATVIPQNLMSVPSSLPELASVQRVLLLTGLVGVEDVVAWADSEIETSDVPANTLIDLAMSRSKSPYEVAALLRQLSSDPNDKTGIKHAFRIIADRVRSNAMDIETAIMSVYNFLRDENLLYGDDEFLTFCVLEDECADIRDGVYGNGDLTVLRNPLLDALDKIAAT